MGRYDGYGDNEFPLGKLIGGIIIGIIVIVCLFECTTIVPAGHRGVMMWFGAVEDRVLGEGIYIKMPFVESAAVLEVRTQAFTSDATAATGDLLDVKTSVTINYHVIASDVKKLYQELGIDYRDRIILPAVQETVKAVTAKYKAEDLITKRAEVRDKIEEQLMQKLSNRYLIIETISITNFEFPEIFNTAITAKQTAIQLALKATNDLERIKIEAEQVATKASGEARAIEIIQQQLTVSPDYIKYMATQRWDGKLPLATGGSGAMPFIQIANDGS